MLTTLVALALMGSTPTCRTEQLHVWLARTGAALGTVGGYLAFTNRGATCTLQGWPTLKFLGANNGALAVPEQKVEKPGAAPSITLAPGRTAFAGIKWVLGDKAETSTFVATSVTVAPPNHTAVKANLIGTDGKVAGYLELPLKSVQVGTLQPSSQGVLF